MQPPFLQLAQTISILANATEKSIQKALVFFTNARKIPNSVNGVCAFMGTGIPTLRFICGRRLRAQLVATSQYFMHAKVGWPNRNETRP